MADIFLSYSRVDRAGAEQIAAALAAEGFSVWWDKVLRAGQTYDEVTEGMLREAKAVIVLWSRESVKSKWVRAEATLGQRSSALIPVMIEDAERPILFELVQTADLIGWDGDAADPRWRMFIDDLRLALGAPEQTMAEQAAAVAEAASATGQPTPASMDDGTIETTFWTSIKDGADPADFQAYLDRYPDGHYAPLARNRLNALSGLAQREASERQAALEAAEAAAAEKQAALDAAAERERHLRLAAERAAAEREIVLMEASASIDPAPAPAPQTPPAEKTGVNPAYLGAAAVFGLAVLGGALAMSGVFSGGDGTSRPEGAAGLDTTENTALAAPSATQTAEGVHESAGDDEDAAGDAPSGDSGQELELAANEGLMASAGAPLESAPDTNAEPAAAAAETEPASEAFWVFADCSECPEMMVLPSGVFAMGSPADERGRAAYEGPQRQISVDRFAIGLAEVTFDQWQACLDGGGCGGYRPADRGYGRGDQPALSISWNDAQAYARWLSSKSGRSYRLPSEAEWEYAARGGAQSAYWWGETFDNSRVITGRPSPAFEQQSNLFGLTGMLGNVREWVEDCYVNTYSDRPETAEPVRSGDCSRRVIRGGDWTSSPAELRAANRARISVSTRERTIGFRVATSDLPY